MEHFEKEIFRKTPKKPEIWFRYIDDTFVLQGHGRAELRKFLIFLNNQHPNIHFTIDIEKNGKLPFLDILASKKTDGTLSQVYRKSQIDIYMPSRIQHKNNLQSIHLYIKAFTISDKEHLQTELNHLKLAVQKNGHDKKDIMKTINKCK